MTTWSKGFNIIYIHILNGVNINFYKSTKDGTINEVPYLAANLNELYYQDSVNPNKVGTIKIIESNF